MMPLFTLLDTDDVLEPESYQTFIEALDRGGEPLWSCHNWIIVDNDGNRVASRVDLAKMRDRADRKLSVAA